MIVALYRSCEGWSPRVHMAWTSDIFQQQARCLLLVARRLCPQLSHNIRALLVKYLFTREHPLYVMRRYNPAIDDTIPVKPPQKLFKFSSKANTIHTRECQAVKAHKRSLTTMEEVTNFEADDAKFKFCYPA
jgi:hypothetical protein